MVSQHKGQCIRRKVKNKFILSFKKPIKKIWALLFYFLTAAIVPFQQEFNTPAFTLVFSACQISKNRAYATKSHRFLFLLRFVHSFRLRFTHNGGYQQFRQEFNTPAFTLFFYINSFCNLFISSIAGLYSGFKLSAFLTSKNASFLLFFSFIESAE